MKHTTTGDLDVSRIGLGTDADDRTLTIRAGIIITSTGSESVRPHLANGWGTAGRGP